MNLDTADSAAPHAGSASRISERLWMLWGMSMAVAGSGVGLLFDELAGLNWTLWTWLGTAGFVYWARRHGRVLGTRRATLLTLICVLATAAAFTGMLSLQIAVAGGVLVLAALLIINTGRLQAPTNPARMMLAPLSVAVELVEEAQLRSAEAAAALRSNRSLPAVRGVLIATPIVLAFFLLLSGADPTLADWRNAAWHTLSSFAFVPRALFFIVLGIATLGAYSIAARFPAPVHEPTRTTAAADGELGATERLIILGSVMALFAFFLVLQISHLFEDAGSRVGSGVTYAQAAHRGFVELTLTATLAAILVILLHKLARHDGRERERLVQYCAVALLAELLPMLLSANSRLSHYEAAYGYTLLRLYVHFYIGLVCVAMLMLARQVLTGIDLQQLSEWIGVAVVIAFASLAFWNHAAWIVERNFERYQAGQPLDAMYLMELAAVGPDTTPALITSLRRLDASDLRTQRLRIYLLSDQHGVLDGRQVRWFRWNLRRAQAKQAIERVRGASSDM